MADAVTFYRNLIAASQQYITALQNLQTYQDRLANDPALAAAAAQAAQTAGRPDLTETDFVNVGTAITQFAFTFNSGDPPLKSYLYQLL